MKKDSVQLFLENPKGRLLLKEAVTLLTDENGEQNKAW
jgi:hypothetical protein